MGDFEAGVRHRDQVSIIDLIGDFDGRAQDALDRAWSSATADNPPALVLHFGQVGYINSTGLALIVGMLGKARSADIDVRVVGLSDHYRHVFEITRLADFMTIVGSEEDAVADGSAAPT